jgi:murein DD-endopeptidase MepM/ murein hydrolase activator NlpD
MVKMIMVLIFLSSCNVANDILKKKMPNEKGPKVTIDSRSIINGFELIAENPEFCPITIKVNFELTNMRAESSTDIFIIPARAKNFVVTRIRRITEAKYQFRYTYIYNYGAHQLNKYDENFKYYLPFKRNETILVSQGYNGERSHQGEMAIDFEIPKGTSVLAARDGIVIEVVDSNTVGCPELKCKDFANYILVFHNDGTFANYVHLIQNGSKVKIGEIINIGQVIAESGNTGYSTGPHLHFEVFQQKMSNKVSLKTQFLMDSLGHAGYLIEGKTYLKNY